MLTDSLNSPEEDIRGLAVLALQEVGGGSQAILEALAQVLHDSCETVRRRAARSIAEFGLAATSVLPNLIACLNDESQVVRLECVATLGRLGHAAAPALPQLFHLFLESDLRSRVILAFNFRKIGTAAVDFAVAMVQESDPYYRESACELLGSLQCLDDYVIESLLECCTDVEPEVRQAAREALDRLQQFA